MLNDDNETSLASALNICHQIVIRFFSRFSVPIHVPLFTFDRQVVFKCTQDHQTRVDPVR